MEGRRIYETEDGNLLLFDGDYGFSTRAGGGMGRPPGCNAGSFIDHDVTEHEDGTITVSPSIRLSIMSDVYGELLEVWHGYLERGIWREV